MKKIASYIMTAVVVALMSGCDLLLTSYDFDYTPNPVGDIRLSEYLSSGRDTTLAMFSSAVEMAGIGDMLSGNGNQTLILPNNAAFRSLLKSAGVSRLSDLPSNIIRQLLLYCFVPGRQLSYNLEMDVKTPVVSASGDSLVFYRVKSGNDKYHILINPPRENDPTYGCQQFTPCQQDIILKDFIVQVVDYFPQYVVKGVQTDSAPDREDGGSIRWDITGDTHYYSSAAAGSIRYNTDLQCGYRTVGGQNRTALLLFDRIELPYDPELLFAAYVNIYVSKNITSSPLVTTLSFWDMSSIQNRPSIKEIAKGNITLVYNNKDHFADIENIAVGSWNSADITEYIREFFKNPARTQMFWGIRPDVSQRHASGSVYIGWLDEDFPDDKSHFPSYITLVKKTKSELSVFAKDFECLSGSILTLGTEHINSFAEGAPTYTYTDNNILYDLVQQPTLGVLTRNGLPLKNGVKFTQDELKKGIIKYFSYGQAGVDDLVLHVSDYTMAVVFDNVNIKVTVK